MPFQRLDLVVAGGASEALCDALAAAGAIATDVSDALEGAPDEEPAFGEPGAGAPSWRRARVRALFPAGVDVSAATEAALAACGITVIDAASIERVEDADWVRRTQEQFGPIRAGERLWIVPGSHAPP